MIFFFFSPKKFIRFLAFFFNLRRKIYQNKFIIEILLLKNKINNHLFIQNQNKNGWKTSP